MFYLSTRDRSIKKSFNDILFEGLSKDGGLYLPSEWPIINVKSLKGKNYNEIAYDVIFPYVKESIISSDLKKLIEKSYSNFNHEKIAPLIDIEKNRYILELFYGPTLAFKDYAMQFLGNLFTHILKNKSKKITILGATSGDTGSAAINAFKGKKDIKVFILHPYNKVSEVQRRQMTTVLDENINNIAIKGTFDDCQKIVKQLFLDNELQSKTSLTAINSINWARIISQTVYFFWAFSQVGQNKINFIVPSGNFGNIFSARIAGLMGLPIESLTIVTNENDILHRTISSNIMKTEKVRKTFSPSMDIQISSNFERQLFESSNRDSKKIKELMSNFNKKGEVVIDENIIENIRSIYSSNSVSDSETLETIKLYYDKYNYLADPHTATGLNILSNSQSDSPIVSLACAHPSKFEEAILKAIKIKPPLPKILKNIFELRENMTILDSDKNIIKKHIIKSI